MSDREYLANEDRNRAKRAILDHLHELEEIAHTVATELEELATELHTAEIQITRWLDVLK